MNRNRYIFGAGMVGGRLLETQGGGYSAFIDNDTKKSGAEFHGLKVLSFPQYLKEYRRSEDEIIVAAQPSVWRDITQQLKDSGITDYRIYDQERIISFCPSEESREDIILYHVLHNIRPIFYIDVGANDPWDESVTKFFYAFQDASGINIEPQKVLWERLQNDRHRDINLNVACGSDKGTMPLYVQSGASTLKEKYRKDIAGTSKIDVDVVPLSEICNQYVGDREIHFLKVDVEGFELEVFQGCDFARWRPWIICAEWYENVFDRSGENDYRYLLAEAGYNFSYEYGANKYFVAKEHTELTKRFLSMDELEKIYNVTYVK